MAIIVATSKPIFHAKKCINTVYCDTIIIMLVEMVIMRKDDDHHHEIDAGVVIITMM